MSKKPTMASQLAEANGRISELESELGEGEHDHGTSAVFIREQIDLLATDADTASAPATPEQWKRCLQGILKGSDWRYGTWK